MESTLPFTIFLLSQTMHNAFPSPSISIRHVSFHHVVYLHRTAPATQSSSVCKFACSTSSLLLLLLQGGAYLWEGLRDIQALVRTAGVKSRRPTGKGFGDLRLWGKEKDRDKKEKWPVPLKEREGQGTRGEMTCLEWRRRRGKKGRSDLCFERRKRTGHRGEMTSVLNGAREGRKGGVTCIFGRRRRTGEKGFMRLWTKEKGRWDKEKWPVFLNEGVGQGRKGVVTCNEKVHGRQFLVKREAEGGYIKLRKVREKGLEWDER